MATLIEQRPFTNEPLRTFQTASERASLAAAISGVRAERKEYDLIIGGQRVQSDKQFASINPSHPNEIVGRLASATVEQAREAIGAAERAFSRMVAHSSPGKSATTLCRCGTAAKTARRI